MRFPLLPDKTIDLDAVAQMTDYAIQHGINYFDTALPYHDGNSETVIGEILSHYPRESWMIADKFPGHQHSRTFDPAGTFERQLEKCRVDYFDFYLYHNICENSLDDYMDPRWGILEYFAEQREAGRIKHLGFSCHATADNLEKILDGPYGQVIEFVQIQLNTPAFSYTGFRYVEVETDKGVRLLELTGLHTTTDAPETGSFACSDTLFNRIHDLIDWAIRSNLVSITTDCPTREKLGWQEQNHLMAHSMMYRYDMRALMNKNADDLADSQHPDGSIPTTAPEYTPFEPGSGFEDTPEWSASFVLCPWYTYCWYGDDSALRKHYPAMKRYLGYLSSRAEGGIVDYGLGDWFDIGPERPGKAQLTSVALSATATYHYLLSTMEQIALHLGRDGDAAHYAELAAKVRKAFNERFYNGGQTVYEKGSQAGLAMALYMGLVPPEHRDAALGALVRDIESRGYALTAGDVGFRYVVQTLQQNGRSDVIYKMNHNPDIPGYAWQLKKGATALTESWQAYDDVSNNHLMLGHLMEWLYGGLGGIRPVAPGRLVIAPQMVGDITWTKTSLQTAGGPVRCNWTRSLSDGSWTVEVEVPSGYEAEIRLPDGRVLTARPGNYTYSSRR